jgi:serine phosphatase RsbU (regulator of sigma subunit)
MLFLPLAIKAFFYLIWDIRSKLSYWLYSGVIIIMFFIILLTSRFELILLLMGYLYPYLIIYPLARLIFVAFKERQTRKKEANIILLIIVLNIAAALNDYLKFQGTWYLPELSPYGLCAFFIAASVLLENRIIRHQKNIEDRNIVLERALLERISEKNLRQQQLKVDTVLSFFIREKILANRSINIKNFKGEFFSKPVDNIGRDYFDIFPITGGKHCILLCDLSYAGISAVLLSAHLRLNRDKFLKKKLSLQNIHKIIKELNPMEGERKNMGLLLLFLDPKRKIIQLINDSMPKPLLYSSKFGATSELSSLNEDVQNPLDKSPNTLQTKKIKTPMAKNPSLTNEFPMGKGDRLILVSNGIPNSTSMSDFVQFGSWNTLKFFSATKKIPMQDLGEIFFTELEIFLEGKKQQNDWTFFVIEST